MTYLEHIIFFDGSCGFCSNLARVIRMRDKLNKFTFIPLQSIETASIPGFKEIREVAGDTLIYYDGNRYFYRSEAAIRILSTLGGFYRLSTIFMLVPKKIRDHFYNLVARNRNKRFNTSKECRVGNNI